MEPLPIEFAISVLDMVVVHCLVMLQNTIHFVDTPFSHFTPEHVQEYGGKRQRTLHSS